MNVGLTVVLPELWTASRRAADGHGRGGESPAYG
jgi:hypothetical protein